MLLPSELRFTALLQYSPRGSTRASVYSKSLTLALKNDSHAMTREGKQPIIPYVAQRLREEISNHECLRTCFEGDVIAVPAPRSAPLVPGGLWPSRKLCDALLARGVVKDVQPLLIRKTSVNKSATARPGERPSPESHFASLAVMEDRPLVGPSTRVVIVDDVITRGATLLACYARLREALPDAPILCFAFVRTMSGVEVDSVLAPVSGRITTTGHLRREP